MDYQAFLKRTLAETSKIANERFGKVEGRIKPDDETQVLTDTDLEIGKHIIERIKDSYPGYNVIDEEAGVINNGSQFTWVVDPIDGTSNFAAGVPTYGTIIGLLDKDIPIAGGIALPYFSEIIIAQERKGARLNGNPIHVTKETDLSKTLIAFGVDPNRNDPDKTRQQMKIASEIMLVSLNLRTSNSTFDDTRVAQGLYGGWMCFNTKIWDNIGSHVIMEEAGGVYTDFYGKQLDYSDPLSKSKSRFTNCAASPALHKKLQDIIHNL